MHEDWKQAIKWERSWWGNCANTLGEEIKQTLYAERMGLTWLHDGKSPYTIDMAGASVLDIGGGPCSLLLKGVNRGRSVVCDPCEYPRWTRVRYAAAEIEVIESQGEEIGLFVAATFDECWIYNVLQHTADPKRIAANARRLGRIVRVFEWIDTVTNEGHPHALTRAGLDDWFGGRGKVETVKERGCFGKCWYGIFKGDAYGR